MTMYDIFKPLNPVLYGALKKAFGTVKVFNRGQPFHHRPGKDGKLEVLQPGEYYAVNCPFCGDRKYRLWINHRWDMIVDGSRLSYLAICYRSHCERLPDFVEQLRGLIRGYRGDLMPVGRLETPHTEGSTPDLSTDLPPMAVALPQIPDGHPVWAYLAGRGITRQLLVQESWPLYWCPADERPYAAQALIFPVQRPDGKIVGWQARQIRNGARYVTAPGTPRSRAFYNSRALKEDPVVVVEGPFDALRVGPRALAVLGFPMSYQQIMLLKKHAVGKVMLLYDGDVYLKREFRPHMMGLLRELGSRIRVVKIPADKDPADLTREQLGRYLSAAMTSKEDDDV